MNKPWDNFGKIKQKTEFSRPNLYRREGNCTYKSTIFV